jgi:hypothetical protein
MAVFFTSIVILNSVKTVSEQRSNRYKDEQNGLGQRTVSEGSIFSHLPIVVIDTGGQEIEKENYIMATISIVNNSVGNCPDGTPELTAAAAIKFRGESSFLTFDKKQYRIEFRQDQDKEKNKSYSVLGMGPASDWVLNGPFLDRSVVRNRLIYGISRQLFRWAPDTRYCEVFIDGEYQGLYLMIEPVTNEESRLNLTEFSLLSGQTAYVVKRDRSNTEENVIKSYGEEQGKTSYQLSISFPTPRRLTKAQYRWIENDFREFEQVLYSSGFADPELGYAKYIDVQSFVDYFIINEFTLTTDAGYLSTYVYKDLNGKLHATVWDFNNSFNNYPWDAKSTEKFYVAHSNWYDQLFQDRQFTDAVVARYRELRNGVLSETNLLRLIDDNVSTLGDAVGRNFEKWGYTFKESMLSSDAMGNDRDPASHEEAIEQLKQCILMRGDFLDNNIETLYQYAIN